MFTSGGEGGGGASGAPQAVKPSTRVSIAALINPLGVYFFTMEYLGYLHVLPLFGGYLASFLGPF